MVTLPITNWLGSFLFTHGIWLYFSQHAQNVHSNAQNVYRHAQNVFSIAQNVHRHTQNIHRHAQNVTQLILRCIDTLSGMAALSKLYLSVFWKVVYSKRKEFAHKGWGGGKFFLFRVDPFSEGDWCARKQTGSYKSCLPCKMAQNLPSVSRPLNRLFYFIHRWKNVMLNLLNRWPLLENIWWTLTLKLH